MNEKKLRELVGALMAKVERVEEKVSSSFLARVIEAILEDEHPTS